MSKAEEMRPSEDIKFDYLTDVRYMDAAEARLAIYRERTDAASRRLVDLLVNGPKPEKKPHYSRRGGRSYPEPSDSELDPYWNNSGSNEPQTEVSKAALHKISQESHEDLKRTWIDDGVSPTQAEARMKAHRDKQH